MTRRQIDGIFLFVDECRFDGIQDGGAILAPPPVPLDGADPGRFAFSAALHMMFLHLCAVVASYSSTACKISDFAAIEKHGAFAGARHATADAGGEHAMAAALFWRLRCVRGFCMRQPEEHNFL